MMISSNPETAAQTYRGKPRPWMVMVAALWAQWAIEPRWARMLVPAVGTMFALAELSVKTTITSESVTASQFGRTLRSVALADIVKVESGVGARSSKFWSSGLPLRLVLRTEKTAIFPWLRGRADVAQVIEARMIRPS